MRPFLLVRLSKCVSGERTNIPNIAERTPYEHFVFKLPIFIVCKFWKALVSTV